MIVHVVGFYTFVRLTAVILDEITAKTTGFKRLEQAEGMTERAA
jgi:hypothetical protein